MVFDKLKRSGILAPMHDSPWFRGLPPRLASHWRLKLGWIPAFMAAFFASYFLVLNHPLVRVTTMPATALDFLVGFHPGALALYVSLWIYVLVPPALMDDTAELAVFALAGLAIFIVWPTAVPHWEIDWSRYAAFARLKTVDAAGNACPSLHAAFAVFSAVWIGRVLRRMQAPVLLRAVSVCWCAGILYSTIATRQHVAVDLFAGAALGGIVALLVRPPAAVS
jgi:membrane-associated phospholipid phosphatase